MDRAARAAALAALVAQVLFVACWLVAATWQGARYDAVTDSISDLYARDAPAGAAVALVLTACGAAVVAFAVLSLRPALRPAGALGEVGCALLAVSIFGLGDVLAPFERVACRAADAGCTPALQVGSAGGRLDAELSRWGLVAFVAACLVLAAAMRRAPGWRGTAWPTAVAGVVVFGLYHLPGAVAGHPVGGVVERALAAVGAALVALLAARVLRGPQGTGWRAS